MKLGNKQSTSFRVAMILLALVLLVVAVIVAIGQGSVPVGFRNAWESLLFRNQDKTTEAIVHNLRLPRILIAVFVGMALAASGCILQAVVRNPMADPGIIGISSGASFVTILIMMVLPQLTSFIPLFSFCGAMLACLIINTLAYTNGEIMPTRLVLSGVAVNAIFGAGTSIISVLNSEKLGSVLMWLNGSLVGRSWEDARLIIPYAAVGILLSFLAIPTANVLQLGDDTAKSLGINLLKSRLLLIALAAYLAGITVSFVGIIGFVGLVIPRISRMLVSSDYKFMLPLSVILGGLLVLVADTCARTLFMPIELPVGSLISLVGGPFFVYLLRKSRRLGS